VNTPDPGAAPRRLQSKPCEEVLSDLASAASSIGQDAWDANFSKVGRGGGWG